MKKIISLFLTLAMLLGCIMIVPTAAEPAQDDLTVQAYLLKGETNYLYLVFSEKITDYENLKLFERISSPEVSATLATDVTLENEYTLRYTVSALFVGYQIDNQGGTLHLVGSIVAGNKTLAMKDMVGLRGDPASTGLTWTETAYSCYNISYEIITSVNQLPGAFTAKAYLLTDGNPDLDIYIVFTKKITDFSNAKLYLTTNNGELFTSEVATPELVNDFTLKYTLAGDSESGLLEWSFTNVQGRLDYVVSPTAGNETIVLDLNQTFRRYELFGTWDATVLPAYNVSYEVVTSVDDIPVPPPYTVSIGTNNVYETTRNHEITFTVSTDYAFASGEVVLTYDPSVLSFVSTTAEDSKVVADETTGTLYLETYGQNNATTIDVVFEATKVAESTTVSIESAAFSTADKAASSDLLTAAINAKASSASVEVLEDTYIVVLGENLVSTDGETGSFTLVAEDSLTFKVTDAFVALYDDIVVMAGDVTLEPVEDVYTVDFAATVTVTGTPKSFDVTVKDDENNLITLPAGKPTYKTAYVVTLPDNVPATDDADGYNYSAIIKINDVVYATVTEKVTTIPGDKIVGDVEITLVTTTLPRAAVNVTVTGETSVAGQYATLAAKNGSYTITITPVAGYTYTVTAFAGEDELTVTFEGNVYTITGYGESDFTVNIDATVATDGLTVNLYVTLDGTNMWLVRMPGTLGANNVYKYGDKVMVWSENYQAHVCLIVSVEQPSAELTIVDGELASITYSYDVNMANPNKTVVDANDAQLVYNMYKGTYDGFTAEVTETKYLLADVNKDGKIDVEDAVAIVNNILVAKA